MSAGWVLILWIGIGIFLGTLYTVSIRFEIGRGIKKHERLEQRNPLFSILRILLCSVVLALGFRQEAQYGFACLVAFLIAKYISLIILIKKIPKGE